MALLGVEEEDGVPVISSFDAKAAQIMRNLQDDFGLTPEQSAGFVGNLAHETGGFKFHQEIKPKVPGSRGGAGWAQWTGPRRKKFEQWAAKRGLDTRSDAANYGFLKHELETSESGTLEALRKTKNARDAALVVEKKFERSGVKNYKSRYSYADKALNAFKKVNPDYTAFTNAAPTFTASGAANMGTSGQAVGGVTPRSAIAPSIAASGTSAMGMGSTVARGTGLGGGIARGIASATPSPAATVAEAGPASTGAGVGNAFAALGGAFGSMGSGGGSSRPLPQYSVPQYGGDITGGALGRVRAMRGLT